MRMKGRGRCDNFSAQPVWFVQDREEVDPSCPYFSRLARTKGINNFHTGCLKGREDTSHQTHDESKGQALINDVITKGKAKGEFRERLEVDRRDGDPLQEGRKKESYHAPQETEKQRLDEKSN